MKYTDLQAGITIQYTSWNDAIEVGVITEKVGEDRYEVQVNNRLGKILVDADDILQVIDTKKRYGYIPREEPIAKEEIVEEVQEVQKPAFYGLFAEGGESNVIIDNLPNELTIYVPIYDADGTPANDEDIDVRVQEVKSFLKRYYGDYVAQNYGSSYIDQEGNLVMRKHIQVTSYPSDAEFNSYKLDLILQLSIWATEWKQDILVLEYEDVTHFVLPNEDYMKRGGETWIQEAVGKMKKKGSIGAFTKQAKREDMTTIEFAKKVLKQPKGYTLKTRRRANFIKNTNPELF